MLMSILKCVLVSAMIFVSTPLIAVGGLALAMVAGPRRIPAQLLPALDIVLPQPSSTCSITETWSSCALRLEEGPFDAQTWMEHLPTSAMAILGQFGITAGHWFPQRASEYAQLLDVQFRAAGYGSREIRESAGILAFVWAVALFWVLTKVVKALFKTAQLFLMILRGICCMFLYLGGQRRAQRVNVSAPKLDGSDVKKLNRMDSPAKRPTSTSMPKVEPVRAKSPTERELMHVLDACAPSRPAAARESRSRGKGRLNSPRAPLKEVASRRNSGAEQELSAKEDCLLLMLNSSSAEGLLELNGINSKFASTIVDYRSANGPLKSLSDLDNLGLKGLASKILQSN